MRVCLRSWPGLSALTSVLFLCGSVHSLAQQPAPQSSPAASSTQTQPAPSSDLAAQEDALIKKCNEQINVKGQFKEAEETAKQALALSEKMGDKNRIMAAMLYLGSAYYDQGRRPEALEVFQNTAVLARETHNQKALSRALNNIAGVLGETGRYEESIGYLYQCLDVARSLGDQPMQFTALLNVGQLYIRLGDPDKAEAPLLDSLQIARELKHSDMVSNPSKVATEMALLVLGSMEGARERFQPALKYFEQVRQSHPDNAQTQVQLLNAIGVAHQRLGEPRKALEVLQEAIPIAEKANSGEYPTVVSNVGEAQESLGQLNEALVSEGRALAALRNTGGNPDDEWQIERRIGHIDRALGHNEEALEHYGNSVHAIDLLRAAALNTETGRASFGARSREVYAETADLLHDLHSDDQALEMAERGRARAFLDMLAMSRSGLPDELTPEQRQQEDSKLAQITAVQKQLWSPDLTPAKEKKIKADLIAAEDDFETFHVEVRRTNPRYASIQYPEPIKVAQIQRQLLEDGRIGVVEYLLGEKRSLAWVVTKTDLHVSVLPPRREIEEQVAAYRKLLTQHASALTLKQSLQDIRRLGAKLYASLIQPLEPAIRANRTLIIVPDGALAYLPFEALVPPASRGPSAAKAPSFLVEEFAVLYGPSASALVTVQLMKQKPSELQKKLLAFGDPNLVMLTSSATSSGVASRSISDNLPSSTGPYSATSSVADDYTERGFSFTPLPHTRDEVLAISKLFLASQRQVYLGSDAREEIVKSAKLDDFRYIHFASHGFIDEAKPGRSGIVLSRDPKSSEDGVLQMDEIMRLKLNADLVTLSACSTGLGKLVSGEGILGLTRAFFYAGAQNITVSLWNVNDSATAVLMKSFYRNLNRNLGKSDALREAKIALLRGENITWHHPYFWAPFILVGEGK